LGFIVSNKGIIVDPLKVKAIVRLPLLANVRQLQSLQGKYNFLRCFIVKYANITKGFMCLLKDGVPFTWDEIAQSSFDAIKQALIYAPLLSPPDYSKDFILYLVASDSTIGVVLVQEDDVSQEHVIYYLSRSFTGPKLKYSHVEKLAVAVVFAVQRICHYILLKKTTVIADVNLFQYVLTQRVIEGKYNKWIVILQEFDLEFQYAKSKKSLVFVELISEFLSEEFDEMESFIDELILLISLPDPWYGDILIYLQTVKCP